MHGHFVGMIFDAPKLNSNNNQAHHNKQGH